MLFRNQMARVGGLVAFGLYLPLRRTGDKLVLSRGGVESYLAYWLLLLGAQLGLDVYLPLLLNKPAVV